MALLSATDQQTLRDAFAGMQRPVTILFFTQTLDCDTCIDTRRILDELSSVSDRIVVEEVNLILEKDRAAQFGIDRAPGLVLLAGEEQTDTRVRFLGAPSGYDFMSLVDAILVVSDASPQTLSQETVSRLAEVTDPLTLQVFVTPT